MKRTYTTLPYTEYSTTAYDANRTTIDRVVLHSTAGTLQAAINTFSSPNAQTSAHYILDNDGKLYAGLEEYNVAYHAGNYAMNQRSIGLEHVDNGATIKLHTDAQYDLSIRLVADICKFYSIPCDTAHIIPHNAIVPTACPNGLDVNRIVTGAQRLINPPTDDCPAKLTAITAERDRLNGVITGKDETLANLNSTIEAKNRQIADLEGRCNQLSVESANLSERITSLTEQSLKVKPLEEQVAELERQKKLWGELESSYKQQINGHKVKWDLIKLPYTKLLKKLLIDKLL